MARALRIEYPGAYYHLMNREQRQESTYNDPRDHERFLDCLERMCNHFHLIRETPEGNLSKAMHWLHVAYATYINRRHQVAWIVSRAALRMGLPLLRTRKSARAQIELAHKGIKEAHRIVLAHILVQTIRKK